MVEKNRNSAPQTSAPGNRPADPEYALIRQDNWPKVIREPFPYIVIDNALPDSVFSELSRTLPADDFLAGPRYKGPNRYHRRGAVELLNHDGGTLSETWTRFLNYHLGQRFYRTCLSLFWGDLRDADSVFRKTLGAGLDEIQPAMRRKQGAQDKAAWQECQISHVTPAETPGSPLGPHVDREVALWAGLYYLRGVGPDEGGDLVFYRFRDPGRREYWKDRMIPPSLVEPVATIDARANRLVMFVHGPDAIHGVTRRRSGTSARQSVNLVCEAPFKVWDISRWHTQPDVFPTATD